LFLDNWKREELECLRDTGNAKSKRIWENGLPHYFVKPVPTDTVIVKEQFIRAKYEKKEFAVEPPKENSILPWKEGSLVKQGAVVKNWKKRHFILCGTLLLYFKKQKDTFAAGEIPLVDAMNVQATDETIEGRNLLFCITTPTRNFVIQAQSPREVWEWVQTLRNAIKYLCTPNLEGCLASTISIDKSLVTKLQNAVPIQKRKLNKKTFNNTFVGCSLVDYLICFSSLASRKDAAQVGQKLIEQGFIHNVTEFPTFTDDYSLYTFQK